MPIERPPSRPIIIFPNDTENEDDYTIGCEWHEVDPGPLIALYNSFQQCFLDPTRKKPEDFFNALFESRMYTIMAKETNKYVQQRKQACEYFYFKHFIYKILKKCKDRSIT